MATEAIRAEDDPNWHFSVMFNNFLKKGSMASTYKIVFLRSLTDIGKYGDDDGLVGKDWIENEGDKIKITLDFVAARLAKYYWDMDIAFGMRHTPKKMVDASNPDADIKIVKIIRDERAKIIKENMICTIRDMTSEVIESNERIRRVMESLSRDKPPTLEHLASEKMAEFRKEVIKSAMREVLEHLPKDMPNLYTKVKAQNCILVDPSIIGFMKNYAPMIKKALNYALAIQLEKNNPDARYIATKIDEEKGMDERIEIVRRLEIKTE